MVAIPLGDPTLGLPFAHGGPVLNGSLRAEPEHFRVDEELGYAASGEGEHAFLTVRKRERNTADVARILARLAGVGQVAVGYAGLKDRNAVTTQYFTVQLPGRESPDWSQIDDEGIQVLAAARHNRKIRRGSLRGNRFEIRVSQVSGDRDRAEQLLQRIAVAGVPNYFGSQRFGHEGQNLVRVDDLFGGRGRRVKREQRSILLSAARSQLFNAVLAARVAAGNWDQAVDGDVMLLSGSQRQFMHDPDDPSIAERLHSLDLHPSGPLCGRRSRALQVEQAAAVVEEQALQPWLAWIDGLGRCGVDADRRALRLAVADLAWHWADDDLVLTFALPAGCYATAVLRELVSGN